MYDRVITYNTIFTENCDAATMKGEGGDKTFYMIHCITRHVTRDGHAAHGDKTLRRH